jgi:hypothetical protein
VYGVKRPVQQYFNYIVAVSFIGERNPEKTSDLSLVTDRLLSHNVVSSTHRHERVVILS